MLVRNTKQFYGKQLSLHELVGKPDVMKRMPAKQLLEHGPDDLFLAWHCADIAA